MQFGGITGDQVLFCRAARAQGPHYLADGPGPYILDIWSSKRARFTQLMGRSSEWFNFESGGSSLASVAIKLNPLTYLRIHYYVLIRAFLPSRPSYRHRNRETRKYHGAENCDR